MQAPSLAAPRAQAGGTTSSTIMVEWSPEPTATRFQLQFARNSLSAPWKTSSAAIVGGSSTYVLDELEPGTEYIVRIRAAYFREAVWGKFSVASAAMKTLEKCEDADGGVGDGGKDGSGDARQLHDDDDHGDADDAGGDHGAAPRLGSELEPDPSADSARAVRGGPRLGVRLGRRRRRSCRRRR